MNSRGPKKAFHTSLKTKYKLGQEPPWWWKCGPLLDKSDRTKTHDNIYMQGYKVQHYFLKCNEKLMMDGNWWSLDFASLFRMHVVLILRHGMLTETQWNTHVFSSQDDTKPKMSDGIYRMSDDKFRKEPTVEIIEPVGKGSILLMMM